MPFPAFALKPLFSLALWSVDAGWQQIEWPACRLQGGGTVRRRQGSIHCSGTTTAAHHRAPHSTRVHHPPWSTIHTKVHHTAPHHGDHTKAPPKSSSQCQNPNFNSNSKY